MEIRIPTGDPLFTGAGNQAVSIDETFLREITDVRVSLVFIDFEADPNEITEALGIEPDEAQRKGEVRIVARGGEFSSPHNLWSLKSDVSSKDPNVQIRDLLYRIEGVKQKIDPAWNPSFNVLWKSTILGAGSGPFYERDVIEGMAEIGADLFQDLYLVEEDQSPTGRVREDISGCRQHPHSGAAGGAERGGSLQSS